VPNGGLGAAREGIGDDGAMALGVVALVAQERDGTSGGPSQGIEQCSLRGKVLAKITEESHEIAILAQSVTDLPRRAEGAFVGILDAGIGQCGRQSTLRETLAP